MKKIASLLLAGCMALSLAACGGSSTTATTAAATTAAATTAAAAKTEAAKTEAASVATTVASMAETAAASGKKELNIGVLVWKFSDTYGSSVRTAIDKYAKEIATKTGVKINLDMQDGNDDQSTQNNQADVMFAAGKDLIVINLCDTSAGQYLDDLAKKNKVPVLFYNKEPNDSKIVTDVNSIFIGTKPEEAGIMQGEILADLYAADKSIDRNGDGKLQYIEFEGEINNPEAIARTKYSADTAVQKGLQMDAIVQTQVANWDTKMANEMMTAQIAALGVDKIEVVFCNNDDMAIGVIAALNEVGWNMGDDPKKTVTIIGVDATDTALEYVKAGKLAGTVKQDGDAMGKAIVELAVNKAQGKDYLDGTSYKKADDGYSIRIPYAKITKDTK